MKSIISLIITIQFIFSQDFTGLWEGPKEDGRFNNRINNFGPIKIYKDKKGNYAARFLDSYSGFNDNNLYKTKIDGNKITIIFRQWGHPLLKGELKKNKMVGTLEHHGMTEKFTFYKFEERSSNQFINDWKNNAEIFKVPSKSQFKRIILQKGVSTAFNLHKYISDRKLTNEKLYSEQTLNSIGYNYLGKKEYKRAIECFLKNVELFPKDANSYDSLGEAYYKNGEFEKSEKVLRKSLSMNPMKSTKENSLKLLKKMGVKL